MNEPVLERRYGDGEIARILERATEIQIAEPAEAGIDPRHLRRAAMELEAGPPESSLLSTLVGGRLEIEIETIVPGQLTAVGFERVQSIIQQRSRHHGQVAC